MSKKLLFRADGNSKTGLGHLYRLFALVEMFKKEYECYFLTRKNSIINIIPKYYKTIIIPNKILISEEPHWLSEKYNSNEFIIIADGYQFNSEYQKKLRDNGFSLIYIDDLTTEKMFANVVINHSLNLNGKDFKALKETKLALGTEYAILRPKFIAASKKTKKIKGIKEVFICFGGSDHHDITNTALEGVIDIMSIKKINIVLGISYKHNKIYETIKKREKDIFVYKNIQEKKMLDVMNKCQLAIVPSSTISYEICSVKMLILGGYYINNQKIVNRGLALNGLIYNAGNFKNLKPSDFRNKVLEIINDSYENHKKIIKNQSKMFDGKQKSRFNKLIENIC